MNRVNGKTLVESLGGNWSGSHGMAKCPAHDDTDPSLSVTAAKNGVLFHCHSGCSQNDVIDALRRLGLWEDYDRFDNITIRRSKRSLNSANKKPTSSHTDKTEYALGVWKSAVSTKETLVEIYLNHRGLHLSIPPSLRFHGGLKHRTGGDWPAMVALVTRGLDAAPLAIHRTFLARDGAGKAPIDPQKMMLGPCRGGAVRLGEPGSLLMVGEGIETCLSAVQATGNPAWAALSTSGLRTLDLPKNIGEVIVLADGDEPGEKAAKECALRWLGEGRRVRITRPPQGQDFNDMLLGLSKSNGELS